MGRKNIFWCPPYGQRPGSSAPLATLPLHNIAYLRCQFNCYMLESRFGHCMKAISIFKTILNVKDQHSITDQMISKEIE